MIFSYTTNHLNCTNHKRHAQTIPTSRALHSFTLTAFKGKEKKPLRGGCVKFTRSSFKLSFASLCDSAKNIHRIFLHGFNLHSEMRCLTVDETANWRGLAKSAKLSDKNKTAF
jgi:hypothetical protein